MADFSERLRGLIEGVSAFVPGYAGYLELERRRDTDRLLRERLADRLHALRGLVQRQTADASRGGGMDLIDELGRALKALERGRDRLRYAAYGYSGFFDLAQVDQAKLEQLHQADLALGEAVAALERQAVGGGADLEAARALTRALQAFDDRLDAREALLKGGS